MTGLCLDSCPRTAGPAHQVQREHIFHCSLDSSRSGADTGLQRTGLRAQDAAPLPKTGLVARHRPPGQCCSEGEEAGS